MATTPTHRSAGRDVHHGAGEFARQTFWILALAVIGCYAFFLLLGAYSVTSVWPFTLVVVLLAGLWLFHARVMRHSPEAQDDHRLHEARERRGF